MSHIKWFIYFFFKRRRSEAKVLNLKDKKKKGKDEEDNSDYECKFRDHHNLTHEDCQFLREYLKNNRNGNLIKLIIFFYSTPSSYK